MAKTYEELLAGATQIKNNELPESNTHSLVGGQLLDMVEKSKNDKYDTENKIAELDSNITLYFTGKGTEQIRKTAHLVADKKYRLYIINPDFSRTSVGPGVSSVVVAHFENGVAVFDLDIQDGATEVPDYFDFTAKACDNSNEYRINIRADIGEVVYISLEEINNDTNNYVSNPLNLKSIPPNKGVENAIRRARQLSDFKFTPVFDLVRVSRMCENNYVGVSNYTVEDVFKSGIEYRGVPYSEAGSTAYGYYKNYVGTNVALDTLISSLRNSRSAIAKESSFNKSGRKASLYGSVCSSLSSYCIDIPCVRTSRIPYIDGLNTIGVLNTVGITGLALMDFINKSDVHVAIVTDIDIDNELVELTESTVSSMSNIALKGEQYGGTTRRKWWNITDLMAVFGEYIVYRYSYLREVSYKFDKYSPMIDEGDFKPIIDFPCIPYRGNNALYFAGEIPNTTVLVATQGLFKKLAVKRDGLLFNSDGSQNPYSVSGDTVDVGFSEVGNYEAYLYNEASDSSNGAGKTMSCYWRVTSRNVSPVIKQDGENLTITFTVATEEDVLYGIGYDFKLNAPIKPLSVSKNELTYTAVFPKSDNHSQYYLIFKNRDIFWDTELLNFVMDGDTGDDSDPSNWEFVGNGQTQVKKTTTLTPGKKYRVTLANPNFAKTSILDTQSVLVVAHLIDGQAIFDLDLYKNDNFPNSYDFTAVECDNSNEYRFNIRADVGETVKLSVEEVSDGSLFLDGRYVGAGTEQVKKSVNLVAGSTYRLHILNPDFSRTSVGAGVSSVVIAHFESGSAIFDLDIQDGATEVPDYFDFTAKACDNNNEYRFNIRADVGETVYLSLETI